MSDLDDGIDYDKLNGFAQRMFQQATREGFREGEESGMSHQSLLWAQGSLDLAHDLLYGARFSTDDAHKRSLILFALDLLKRTPQVTPEVADACRRLKDMEVHKSDTDHIPLGTLETIMGVIKDGLTTIGPYR